MIYTRLFYFDVEAKTILAGWKEKAIKLRSDIYVLFLAYRDPRVSWRAKAVMAAVIGYALSPLDLIPDFLPVIGFLDDLVIVPAGVAVALRMIPAEVILDCQKMAEGAPPSTRSKWLVASLILLVWLSVAYLVAKALLKILG